MLIKPVFIYVLRLLGDKYYIGKTVTPTVRIDNHFNGKGSVWTKKYKPVEVIELSPETNKFHEEFKTIDYMDKYGIDNVRGGSFCEIDLSTDNINTINKMICCANNNCFLCGSPNHFSNRCPLRKIKSRNLRK
jgi:cellular nucleic acid-binding protein